MKIEKKQKIFNKVVEHLLIQARKSVIPGQGCRYRGNNGTKCAIGILISNKEYNPNMENKNIRIILDTFKLKNIDINLQPLLEKLQIIHDTVPIFYWPVALTELASEFNLSLPKNMERLVFIHSFKTKMWEYVLYLKENSINPPLEKERFIAYLNMLKYYESGYIQHNNRYLIKPFNNKEIKEIHNTIKKAEKNYERNRHLWN